MKKAPIIAAVIGVIAAVLVALGLTGNFEKLMRGESVLPAATKSASSPVDDALSAFSNTSNANVEEVLGTPLYTVLVDAGVNPKDVFDAFYGHITYEIDESELPESGPAKVNVTVTNIDAETATKNYLAAMDAWRAGGNMPEEEAALWQHEVELLTTAFNDPALETKTFELVAEVDQDESGAWRIVNERGLFKDVLGGYSPDTLL